MRLTTLGHAAALIELESGKRLLIDPWLEDPAYFNSWWHFPPLAKRVPDLGRIDGVYISHDHPDHCDPKTLARIPRDTEMLIADFASDSVDRILAALQFINVRRMPFRKPFAWHDAVIECFKTDLPWDDSAIMIQNGGLAIFNMNDCKLFDSTLDELGRSYAIDVALLPYSGAIQFPTCYELPAEKKLSLCRSRREEHIRLFVDRARRLRTRHAVPFAAGYCLPSFEQWWMNDINNINSPDMAVAALRGAAPAAFDGSPVCGLDMNPGDTWSPATGVVRHAPPPDWSRHFELVRQYSRSIAGEVAARRDAEPDPEPGLAGRFIERFSQLVRDQRELAKRANYKVVFDARGAHGFVGHVDTTKDPAVVGLDEIPDWNLKIRIPGIMLDSVMSGRVTWDEVLISFRLWFDERPAEYHEPWWALLHCSNRLDPAQYLSRLRDPNAPADHS